MKLQLLFLAAVIQVTVAQFTCVLKGGGAENTCLGEEDDDGQHCVWCSVSKFSFCVNEATAETIEQSVQSAHCDRYSGSDDKEPSTDDAAPATDDAAPATDDAPPSSDDKTPPASDDKVKPSDDTVPDNYWQCLQDKDSKTCASDGCTWCTSKAGFSLCVSGPTADFAKKSDFFKCDSSNGTTYLRASVAQESSSDPFDLSCLQAYMQEPTESACSAAKDANGESCEWCTLAGMANMCLTPEQAEKGSGMGFQCDASATSLSTTESALDISCIKSFFQDQSEESCTSAKDSNGKPCEYCLIYDRGVGICLTEEQSRNANQFGADCNVERESLAQIDEVAIVSAKDDPYDTSCMLAYLEDQSEDACVAAADEDGNPCEFCSFRGAVNFCLTSEQAGTAQQLGATCDAAIVGISETETIKGDLYDKACIKSFLADGSEDSCKATSDESGEACKWCHGTAIKDVCLTSSQGDVMSQLGFWCDGDGEDEKSAKKKVSFPDDFFSCLKNQGENDCQSHSCTWCSTQVGMGFCMSDAAADAMKQCTFFDCDYKAEPAVGQELHEVLPTSPYDTSCLTSTFENQDDAADACHEMKDKDGNQCVWCEASGIVGLCVTSDQANMAGSFLQCDNKNSMISVV